MKKKLEQREKLIELIQESVRCARNWAEVIADHLLENGVSDIKDCEKCKHFKISPAQYPCSHCRNCYTDKFELMDGGKRENK